MRLSQLHFKGFKNPESLTEDLALQVLIQRGLVKYDKQFGLLITPFGQAFTNGLKARLQQSVKNIEHVYPLNHRALMANLSFTERCHAIFEMMKFELKSYKKLPVQLLLIDSPSQYSDMDWESLWVMQDALQAQAVLEDMTTFLKPFNVYHNHIKHEQGLEYHNDVSPCDDRTFDRTSGRNTSLQSEIAMNSNAQIEWLTEYPFAHEQYVCCECCKSAEPLELFKRFSTESLNTLNHSECGKGDAESLDLTGREKSHDVSVVNMVLRYTPLMKTIQALSEGLKIEASRIMKAIALMDTEGNPVMALVPGQRTFSKEKLERALGRTFRMASEKEISEAFHSFVGFVGPIHSEKPFEVFADASLYRQNNLICGANQMDYHYENVCMSDVVPAVYLDLCTFEDDACLKCHGPRLIKKLAPLGRALMYGEAMAQSHRANYLNAEGKAVLQHTLGIQLDFVKLLWREFDVTLKHAEKMCELTLYSQSVPFDAWIIVMNPKNEAQRTLGERLYLSFKQLGIKCVLDDRDEGAGVKFFDAEGYAACPIIVVGKEAEMAKVNIRKKGNEVLGVSFEAVREWVINEMH